MPDLVPLLRLHAVGAVLALIAAALVVPGTAAAGPAPGLDTATATGDNLVTDDFSATGIEIEAHSGPAGENPGGSVSFDVLGGTIPVAGPVSCLDVSGNTAVMTIDGPFPSLPGFTAFLIRIVDNGGGGQDVFQYFPDDPEVADSLDCHEGSSDYFGGPLIGRAVVTDVRPDPPVISALALDPPVFSASSRPMPLERGKGSSIRIGLSTAATVAFKVRRARPADSGGPPPKHTRRFKRALGAGPGSVPFSGTIGDFTLRPGRYRLTARARDSLKQPSERVTTTFRIVP
jgi:hypothetical protein